ncbi:hypothetical protein [Cupriavidus sp. AU9028]|uniref:hypothetical protein n=1 Tax=Cupriavidus sp. AU9028 TaxID=2871157 RepID=UPI001C946A01|nr:hypothetical protein [Cupriavidus sp. AU9028]MBY4898797.1 hypothetical protein [Cupriavidus sp. AU9028]
MSVRKQVHSRLEPAARPAKEPRPEIIALHKRGMQVLLGSIERGWAKQPAAIRPVGIAYSSELPAALVAPGPVRRR